MTKYVLVILAFVAALAAALLYVGNDATLVLRSTALKYPLAFGEVEITWQFAIVLGVLGLIGLLALWTFLGWLIRLPGRLKSGAGLRRRDRALDAMEEALIAGAEGDKSKSRKQAAAARSMINSAALGRMISAQAAEACGDSEEAMKHYTDMLKDEKTRPTGQRGLATQLLAAGDLAGAIQHASTAYADNKSAAWAFDVLFNAQVSDHRWADALDTLTQGESRKHVDKQIARRRRAVLMTAEAQRLENDRQFGAASDLAMQAASDAPAFSPATVMAARLVGNSENPKKALSLIEKTWSVAPHPALVLALRDMSHGESDRTRNKRILSLIRSNPEHRESAIVKAEEALMSGDGVVAWSALSPLMQDENPSARLCLLAARAENMLGNSQDAAVWTERAASAPCEADWSDLDPDGDAFNYTDQDWRRLVYSFGDQGELIHPRFEAGAARREVAFADVEPNSRRAKTKEHDEAPRQPDDPGDDAVADGKDDLASRLDSLLGDDKTAP